MANGPGRPSGSSLVGPYVLYLKGDFSSAIEAARKELAMNADPALVGIIARSAAELQMKFDVADQSLASRCAALLYRIITRTQTGDEPYVELIRITFNLRFTSLSSGFVALAQREFTSDALLSKEFGLSAFALSDYLDPSAAPYLPEAAGRMFSAYLGNVDPTGDAVRIMELSTATPPRTSGLELSPDHSEYWELESLFRSGSYQQVIDRASESKIELPNLRRGAYRLYAHSLLELGLLETAVDYVVNTCLVCATSGLSACFRSASVRSSSAKKRVSV